MDRRIRACDGQPGGTWVGHFYFITAHFLVFKESRRLYNGYMKLSHHMMNRLMQRNKTVADMTKSQIIAKALAVQPVVKKSGALAYVLSDLNLVLVVNPENGIVMTCYKEIV